MTRRRRVAKRRHDRLTFAELDELLVGPHERGSVFMSDDDRRAAWQRHRDDLMGDADRPPPWAFWNIDPAPEHLTDLDLAAFATHEQAIAATEALEQERRHWIGEHGAQVAIKEWDEAT